MQKLFRFAGQIVGRIVGLTAVAVLAACSQQNEEAAVPEVAAPPAIAPISASAEVMPFAIGDFQAAAIADGGVAFPNDHKTIAINASMAASGQRVYAVHFPFPGLGKFQQQGEQFVWSAE